MRFRLDVAAAGALLVLASALPVAAQEAKRDSLFKRLLDFPSLLKGGAVQARWMADSSTFWYMDSTPHRAVVLAVDSKGNTVTPLLDVSRVRQALRAAIGHEPPYEGLPFNTMSFAGGERSVRFNLEGRDWILDRDTYTVKPAPAVSAPERARVEPQLVRRGFPTTNPDQYEVASPDGRWFAGEKDGNIVVRSSADGRIEQLTTDAVSDYGWSVSAARWSPNGQYLAALKSDTRRLHKVPLLHWL